MRKVRGPIPSSARTDFFPSLLNKEEQLHVEVDLRGWIKLNE